MKENKNIKADNNLEAGYVYAPYVPLDLWPTWENLEEKPFMKVKEWLTNKKTKSRYEAKEIRTGYYGVVNVENLDIKL